MILIGSKAIEFWFPDFPRKSKDIDFIDKNGTSLIKDGLKVEIMFAPAFEFLLKNGQPIATPDELYTIKLSHIYWNINWDKHIHDLQFLKKKGCRVIEPFYKELYHTWEMLHGPKKVNLNQTNEKFFTKYVERVFEHDFLHKSVMYYDEPMYDKLKINKEKAWIERSLFEKLEFKDKIRTCKEEAFVIALERFIIPNNFTLPVMVGYRRALKLIVTSLSKGWFPRFIVENYEELKDMKDCDKLLAFVKSRGQK